MSIKKDSYICLEAFMMNELVNGGSKRAIDAVDNVDTNSLDVPF